MQVCEKNTRMLRKETSSYYCLNTCKHKHIAHVTKPSASCTGIGTAHLVENKHTYAIMILKSVVVRFQILKTEKKRILHAGEIFNANLYTTVIIYALNK